MLLCAARPSLVSQMGGGYGGGIVFPPAQARPHQLPLHEYAAGLLVVPSARRSCTTSSSLQCSGEQLAQPGALCIDLGVKRSP